MMLGINASAQKLSPGASVQLMQPDMKKAGMAAENAAGGQKVEVFVRTSGADAIEKIKALGGEVRGVYGNGSITASLPLSAVRSVSELEEVEYIQVANKARLLMDAARKDAGADLAHSETNGLGAYKGEGVVVGIVDSGFEYGHIGFYDSERNGLRIKRVWNQNSTGNSPAGFGYGTEYTSEGEILAARYDVNSSYHGTHVAGIASGADLSSLYYGVAPDADLVLVSYGGTTANITDAVKYIFDYAESVGKPCVVNLSLGSHYGPHDGTSDTDRLFDELTGPGRIIVGAAGNEGNTKVHAGKTFTESDNTLKTMLMMTQYGGQYINQTDIWGSAGSNIKVKVVVVNPLKGNILYESEEASSADNGEVLAYFPEESKVSGYISLAAVTDPENNRPNGFLQCVVTQMASNVKIGVVVTGEAGAEVHLWDTLIQGFSGGSLSGWTGGDAQYSVGEIGGTGKNVVAVGSYTTKTSFRALDGYTYNLDESVIGSMSGISTFSSRGPTLDGRVKPDITAPGAGVASATSQYQAGFSKYTSSMVGSTFVNGREYYYEVNAGTSMASPYVTGTVALWLQANPSLTPQEVLDIIRQSARTDAYTGDVAETGNTWGAGKIDTFEGLKLALSTSGVTSAEAEQQLFRIVTDRSDRSVSVYLPGSVNAAEVEVYSSTGQKAAAFASVSNGQKLSLSSLPAGVYVLKMQQGGVRHSVKIAL